MVWENVASRTSENVEVSHSFLLFMVFSMLIAAVGIYFDEPILIVGAMVVGPDFGPIAGICVALVNVTPGSAALRQRPAHRLSAGIDADLRRQRCCSAGSARSGDHRLRRPTLTRFISNPNIFSVYVGLLAGAVGCSA